MDIDYSRNNGSERLIVSVNSPTTDVLDFFEATYLPLQRLDTLAAVRALLEEYTERAVAQARTRGATWEDIGAYLGVTRQAAQQRYGSLT